MNLLVVVTIAGLAAGGSAQWTGFVVILAATIVVDELVGDGAGDTVNGHRWLLDGLLYLTWPLLALTSLLYVYFLSGADPLALEQVMRWAGFDLAGARAATGPWHLLGGAMSVGICYGVAGINAAHELVHRTDRPLDRIVGRWLLAFNLDTTFMIEHIEGHHRTVATEADPATARRGQNIIGFVVTSTLGGVRHAFQLERRRLSEAGRGSWSLANRALRGQLMSLAYLAVFAVLAGGWGALAFVFMALNGKTYLELVNYIEHYGLVRVPGTPVAARHSWDSRRALSGAILYNLTRHADHHVQARAPYYARRAGGEQAPVLPLGYGAAITLAIFCPRAWHRLMARHLARWDAELASPGERALIAERGWQVTSSPACRRATA